MTKMPFVDGQPIDLEAIPHAFWQAAIDGLFSDLSSGDMIELVSHEDPHSIWALLDALLPGRYTWDYVTRGPVEWRVRLGRRAGHSSAGGRQAGARAALASSATH